MKNLILTAMLCLSILMGSLGEITFAACAVNVENGDSTKIYVNKYSVDDAAVDETTPTKEESDSTQKPSEEDVDAQEEYSRSGMEDGDSKEYESSYDDTDRGSENESDERTSNIIENNDPASETTEEESSEEPQEAMDLGGEDEDLNKNNSDQNDDSHPDSADTSVTNTEAETPSDESEVGTGAPTVDENAAEADVEIEFTEEADLYNDASSSFTYTVSGNEATITGYSGAETTLVIPETLDGNTVSKLANGLFLNSNLVYIELPKTLKLIGNNAFRNSTALKEVVMKYNSTTSETSSGEIRLHELTIGDSAFCGCTSLTDINLTENVTKIGQYAFQNCKSLTNLVLPELITSLGYKMIAGTGIEEMTVPKNVTSARQAFCETTSLKGVTFEEGISTIPSYICSDACYISEVNIPKSVKQIGQSAFSDCSSLTSITIPSSVTGIGNMAFENCRNLTSITLSEGLTSIGAFAFFTCDSLTSIAIPESITSLGEAAFYNCSSLTKVNIPGDLMSIEDSTFKECKKLSSITISEGITSIEDSAFEYCDSLTSITIPHGVTSIGDCVFRYCSNLTNVTIPSDMLTIGNSAFYNCSSLTSISIPDGLKSIGDSAFSYCGSLTNISIPGSLNSIGDSSFSYCGSLTTIILSEGVENIGKGAFKDCESLTKISIPDSVTSIGKSAFSFCVNLSNIVIPDRVNNIGAYAFFRCDSLTSVKIPDGMADISEWAFGCSGLTSVVIPDSVTTIGESAFQGCKLTSITIPDKVSKVGNRAFCACNNLTNMTIPGSLKNIEDETFSECTNLASVNISEGVRSIGNYAFSLCSNLNSIKIPKSVESIGKYAFKECKSLTKITIPDTVTSIGNDAFIRCSGLTHIVIPNSVTNIDDSTFAYCSSITEITIPDSVTNIGDSAFSHCTSLTRITIPNRVTGISYNAFSDCKNLISIVFTGSAPSIRDSAFQDVTASAYYPIEDITWTDATQQNYGGTLTWITYDSDSFIQPNSLKLRVGSNDLPIGASTTITAEYYNGTSEQDTIPGAISWSVRSKDGSKVSISPFSNVCTIKGELAGTCTVTASTDGGLQATAIIHIIEEPEEIKETIRVAGKDAHLSGSYNYVLNENTNGTLDLSGSITSNVTVQNGSSYTADTVTIKKQGLLEVLGVLRASEIHIGAGGELSVTGRVYADTIVVEGGNWFTKNGGILRVQGVLCVKHVLFKGYSEGIVSELSGQIIAEDSFTYKSNRGCDGFSGTLFAGGAMDVGKAFDASSSGLSTVIYDDTSGRSFSFHKKCNLGKVFAKDTSAYSSTGLSTGQRVSALQYTRLVKNETAKWAYNPGTTPLEVDWQTDQGAYYRNLASEQNTTIIVSSLSDDMERDFVSRLAVAWVGSIEAQVNRGLLDFSTSKYEIYFKMNRKEYVLQYTLSAYGNYGNLGTLRFGAANYNYDDELETIGMSAAGSIENFKTGASTYLAEEYVKQYYEFVTGSLPKFANEPSLTKKLARMGKRAVINYLSKNIKSNLFGTLKVTKGAGYADIEKTFKITKLILSGDLNGMWKYAASEVKNTFSSKSATTKTYSTSKAQNVSEIPEIENEEDLMESVQTERLMAGASQTGEAVSQEITDDFLKSELIKILGEDESGNPNFGEQKKITYLDLSEKHIQAINGIQNFSNLQTLILSNNEISDLTPLAEMKCLKYLYVDGQDISDLSPLSNLDNLEVLDAKDNDISSIRPVSGMESLKKLSISNNPVTSLAGLKVIKSLEVLEADRISLEDADLSSLGQARQLRELRLNDSGLQSISGLNLEKISFIDISNNAVETLKDLSQAVNLAFLDASDNSIFEVPSFENCEKLKKLYLSGNAFIDLTGLGTAVSLETLHISACELIADDISSLSALKNLREIDLSDNPMLDDLSILESLDNIATVDARRTQVIALSTPVQFDSGSVDIQAGVISSVNLDKDSYAFNEADVEPVIDIECIEGTLVEDEDYIVSYENNVAAGKATLTITGIGRCVGSISRDFTIEKASVATCTISGIEPMMYTGTAITQMPVVTLDGIILIEGTDYTVSYTNNIKVGTATVTITGTGNYTGQRTANFQILPSIVDVTGISLNMTSVNIATAEIMQLTADVTPSNAADKTITWSSDNKSIATVDADGVVTGIGAGTATITATASDGSGVTETCKVIVTPKSLSMIGVIPASYNKLNVSWEKCDGADGYMVYRRGNGEAYALVKSLSGEDLTSFTNSVVSGTKYTYKISAYKMNGTKKVILAQTVEMSGTALPAAPVMKSTGMAAFNKIKVIWTKVSGCTGYVIYRSTEEDGQYSVLKTVTMATATEYSNIVRDGQTYYYKIRAFVEVNGKKVYGDYSEVLSGDVIDAPPANFRLEQRTATKIIFNWDKVDDCEGYVIYRYFPDTNKCKAIKNITSKDTLTYSYKVDADTDYQFTMRAFREVNGKKVYSDYSEIISN